MRLKHSSLHPHAKRPQRLHKFLIQRLPQFRRPRLNKTRSPLPARIAIQRKLRNRQCRPTRIAAASDSSSRRRRQKSADSPPSPPSRSPSPPYLPSPPRRAPQAPAQSRPVAAPIHAHASSTHPLHHSSHRNYCAAALGFTGFRGKSSGSSARLYATTAITCAPSTKSASCA